MKKLIFCFLAICMIVSFTVCAQAEAVPELEAGYLQVAAVLEMEDGGYAADEDAQFKVEIQDPAGGPGEFFRSSQGVARCRIREGYLFQRLEFSGGFTWLNPDPTGYSFSREDEEQGVLYRFIRQQEPDIPEPPEEPDQPGGPDNPPVPPEEPDIPDLPDVPEEPDASEKPAGTGTVRRSAAPQRAGRSGASSADSRRRGSPGKLKGSRPLPEGGILLNSLTRRAPEPVRVVELAEEAARETAERYSGGDELTVPVPLGITEQAEPELAREISAAVQAEMPAEAPPVQVILQADTVSRGKVEGRMYINAAALQDYGAPVKTSVDCDAGSAQNQEIQARFQRSFENRIAVATFAQKGSFGMPVSAALSVDLSGLNRKSLMFYTYDIETNRCKRIAAEYAIDSRGYLHVNIDTGGSLVIADALLTPK